VDRAQFQSPARSQILTLAAMFFGQRVATKMTTTEHNKIITKAATTILKNHGIKRSGQSRTYHDDNCWFTTLIEFQPHQWDRGTFLNVGVNFHWYNKEYFSFDIGHREAPFIQFVEGEQFYNEIEKLCDLALEKVLEYRNSLKTIDAAFKTITKYEFTSDSLWGNYHKGTISGLIGDTKSMKSHYEKLLKVDHNYDWANELKQRTKTLLDLSTDLVEFRNAISTIVSETRKMKRLTDCQINI
jgi:hypothetical protein